MVQIFNISVAGEICKFVIEGLFLHSKRLDMPPGVLKSALVPPIEIQWCIPMFLLRCGIFQIKLTCKQIAT